MVAGGMILLVVDGVKWFYIRSRICDMMVFSSRAFSWFLFDCDRFLIGYWDTKALMLEYLNAL